jgi:hypothetical protein
VPSVQFGVLIIVRLPALPADSHQMPLPSRQQKISASIAASSTSATAIVTDHSRKLVLAC